MSMISNNEGFEVLRWGEVKKAGMGQMRCELEFNDQMAEWVIFD